MTSQGYYKEDNSSPQSHTKMTEVLEALAIYIEAKPPEYSLPRV